MANKLAALKKARSPKSTRKTIKKKIETFDEELSNTNKELLTLRQALERSSNDLQQFLYVASHDLQEPLRKLQTFSDRIREKEFDRLSDSGKRMFERMLRVSKRMQSIIDDLLAYSRFPADRCFETILLDSIIREIQETMAEDIDAIKGTIEVAKGFEIYGHRNQLTQLFTNLVSNSLKFSKVGRPLRIRLTCQFQPGHEIKNFTGNKDKTYCLIRYTDNGIGFDNEFKEKIFELFQQLHARDEFSGTGIGLTIVKRIVENHDGYIFSKGAPGKGATFDVFLPLKE